MPEVTFDVTENLPLKAIIIDFIILNLIGWPIFFIDWYAEPFYRGYYCHDLEIRHAFRKETIQFFWLYILGLGTNFIVILIVEFLRRIKENSTMKFMGRINVPPWIFHTIYRIVIFLFGAGCCQLTADAVRYMTGAHTPYFFTVCEPASWPYEIPCDSNFRDFIQVYACRNKRHLHDHKLLRDMRLSFPSIHAVYAIYSMLYLCIYLQQRMTWRGSQLLRPTIQVAAMILAIYISVTRLTDYRNHYRDILAGMLLGTTGSYVTGFYFSYIPTRMIPVRSIQAD